MNNNAKRRKPLGVPLDRTDEDLERLAEITPDDVEAAQVAYRAAAPPAYRDLLDATEDDR